MSTYFSVHHIQSIRATTVQGGGCDPHLTIKWSGKDYEASGEITFYLNDAVLNERLIRVINKLLDARKTELKAAEHA